jgi:hypothetical protein
MGCVLLIFHLPPRHSPSSRPNSTWVNSMSACLYNPNFNQRPAVSICECAFLNIEQHRSMMPDLSATIDRDSWATHMCQNLCDHVMSNQIRLRVRYVSYCDLSSLYTFYSATMSRTSIQSSYVLCPRHSQGFGRITSKCVPSELMSSFRYCCKTLVSHTCLLLDWT